MASYSTSNIHNKLGNLTIDSLPEQTEPVPQNQALPFSTKSLLSSSLKGEKFTIQPQIPKLHMDEITRNLTDEHPEPELLATSVGRDGDGRLIPSSSTISLLSLNNNSLNNNSVATNYLDLLPAKPAAYLEFLPSKPVPPVMDRKNSYNNIRSRNSLTHLTQQRLQPYQKLTSPSMPGNAEFASLASPQNIPGLRNQGMIAPDSPNLDPTSIGGSPSRFWLSSQTPPRLLLNSLSKSRTHMYPHILHHVQLANVSAGSNHGNIPINPTSNSVSSSGSLHSVSKAINIKSGGDSPVLIPVQTPLEDFPMTPLFLNGTSDNYFVLTNGQDTREYSLARDYGNPEFDEIEENDREDEDGDDCSMMDTSSK